MADNEEITPESSDGKDADKPLTDEQEDALNKIMAELEGQNEESPPSDSSGDSSEENQMEDNSNGLTDEQEEALQKVMAEIETSNDASVKTKESTPSITAEQEDTLNKIVAELQGESGQNEIEKQNSKDDESISSDDSDSEGLTLDQEEALKKIMTEIEGGASEEDKSEHVKTSPIDQDASPSSDSDTISTPKSKPSEETSDKEVASGDDRSLDNNSDEVDSSDFESELQKVVSEAKSESSQETKPENQSHSTTTGASDGISFQEKSNDNATVNSKSIGDAPEALESKHEQAVEKNSDGLSKNPTDPQVEDEQIKDASVKTLVDSDEKTKETKASKTSKSSKNVSSAIPEPKKKYRFTKIIIWSGSVTTLLIIVLLSIYLYPQFLGKNINPNDQSISPVKEPEAAVVQKNGPELYFQQTDESKAAQTRNDLLENLLSEITEQRNFLLDKLKEINDLKRYYEQGIQETQDNLIPLLREKKISQLKNALNEQKIELGLRIIQRRKAYIVKLEDPFGQILNASENLLYLERKAIIFHLMMANTSGIGLDLFEKQVIDAIQRIKVIKEKLSIDQIAPAPISLEDVWDELNAKMRSMQPQKLSSAQLAKQNQNIWKEICSGNYDRKYALTALNEKVTQCLLQWDGKDLFLNQLTSLTPEVAQILSHWKGAWLGLNGLETLSPEAARHLARWRGKRLSLNGLMELSPKTTLYLSKWQGNQLELIGLKHIGQWENPQIELFVSDKLRSQLPRR